MEERVILVDGDGLEIGSEEKVRAHREPRLHRAFSIFVFDGAGRTLIQQRAAHKYHSASLWANACCSHPRPGERTIDAAHRRLHEEMGFDCALDHAFAFVYRADVGQGLVEHEYDHVFVGRYEGEPRPDPAEVAAWEWAPLASLPDRILSQPDRFAVWFRIALPKLLNLEHVTALTASS